MKKSLLVALLAACPLAASAQTPAAAPAPLETATIVATYAPAAERIVGAALVDDTAWRRLEWLSDRIGDRVSGSPQLEQAIAWAAAELKADGLDVRTERVLVPRWVRGRESAELVAPFERRLSMLGLGNSVGTPPEGVEGEVVVARSWEELDALGDLTGKVVLYDVPFNNLVPSAQMLPVESIRFFYLDQNWIDCLLDGALSVGIQSSRDSLFHQLMRDPLHRVVDAAVGEVRNTLLGISPPTAPAPAGVMAGFVLRSAVVAGWPGLEVRAWSAADSATPMKPLRLDQVAPTVLLGIFPDVPVKLEFNEPSEGLVFGVEGEGANGGVALRYLPGTQGATPDNLGQMRDPAIWLTQADIEQLQRAGPPSQTALKIAGAGGLVEALQNQFPTPAPTLGPAALAVQMIKAPEQMLFLPQNGAKQ